MPTDHLEKPVKAVKVTRAAEAPRHLYVPVPIPEHTLIRPIGSGASGEVWLARNALGTYRAVKIMRPREGRLAMAFESEYSALLKYEPVSRLHDGLVDILQVGGSLEAGYFYYVMELADDYKTGAVINPDTYKPRTLYRMIHKQGRLPVSECIRLGAALASALGFLHRKNLIHRDIKPSNIVFVNGFPKLADVGLLTNRSQPRDYVGTDGFMPPEGGGSVEADLFSMGRVLYEMSTAIPANQYPALPEDLGNSREDRELVQFNQIIFKACRPSPRGRYRSSDELMTALLSFQFNPRLVHWNSRGKPLIWLIGVIGASIGAGFIIFLVWRLIWLLRADQ